MKKTRKASNPDVVLNLNVRGLPQSATLAINEISNRLIKEGKEVFRLGLGQSPFPVPKSVVEALRTNAHQKDYLPVKGLAELRSAVAEYYRRSQQLEFTGDDIIVGPGSKELMFLLQLVYYGDLVIPTPSWVSYAPQAKIVGRHIHWLPTYSENDWRLKPEEIELLCKDDPDKPRILILNYPNNPTGTTYRIEELKQLAKVAKKYRVILLSDEIYGEMHHQGRHVSIARFYPEGTIVSGGLSKWCGAGGWRLGLFAFPKNLHWLMNAMAAAASETFTSTSAPIQFAAVRAFQGGIDMEEYLAHSRRILKTLGRLLTQKLRRAGAQVAEPSGGFYLFPDFSPLKDKLAARGIKTSKDFCARLLEETGVAILPGSDFGRQPGELTARLAYVDFDGARVLAAAEQIPLHQSIDDDFISAYCGTVVKAIDRLCVWVNS